MVIHRLLRTAAAFALAVVLVAHSSEMLDMPAATETGSRGSLGESAGALAWETEGEAEWWDQCGGLGNREPTMLEFYMKTRSKSKTAGKAGKKGTTKNPKTRKTSMNSISRVGFRLLDVGIGCLKMLPKRGFKGAKQYPFIGNDVKMKAPTRLRLIDIVTYESSKYEKKKGGHGKGASGEGTGANTSALTVKLLSKCKVAFSQTKDGHVNRIFATKGSASCKKVKSSIAVMFESYYFSGRNKSMYHVKTRDDGAIRPYRIMVHRHKNGKIKRVCRALSAAARRSKIGPGGHKSKQMKVQKSNVRICNTYTKSGNLFIGGQIMATRQASKRQMAMVKGRRRRAWTKFVKNASKIKKKPKAKAKATVPTTKKRKAKKRAAPKRAPKKVKKVKKSTLKKVKQPKKVVKKVVKKVIVVKKSKKADARVKALKRKMQVMHKELQRLHRKLDKNNNHHAKVIQNKFDVSNHDISKMSVKELMTLNTKVEDDIHNARSALGGHRMGEVKNPFRAPKVHEGDTRYYSEFIQQGMDISEDDMEEVGGHNKAAQKPSQGGSNGNLIKLVTEKTSKTAVEVRSEDDIMRFLGESWGKDNVDVIDPTDDHHSNKGGWVDINPVLDIDYDRTMSLLQEAEDKDKDDDAYMSMIDMMERDPRIIQAFKRDLVADTHGWGDSAHRSVIGAIAEVGDTHPEAQHALIHLMEFAAHRDRALLGTHSINEPLPELLAALQRASHVADPKLLSKYDQGQCTAVLAQGVVASNMIIREADEDEPTAENVALAKKIGDTLATKALSHDSDECYHHAVGNAGKAAARHSKALMAAYNTAEKGTEGWHRRRLALVESLRDMPDPAVDNFLQEKFFEARGYPKLRQSLGYTLSARANGVHTEAAIKNLMHNFDVVDDKHMMGNMKHYMMARVKQFHSPAALSFLETAHAVEMHNEISAVDDPIKFPANPTFDPKSCGKNIPGKKWSCQLGFKKCITFKGIKLGCLGAAAFVWLDWGKKEGMKLGPVSIPAYEASGRAGLVALMFVMEKTLLDVGLIASLKIPTVLFKVWVKLFNFKKMKLISLFNFCKGTSGCGDDGDELGEGSREGTALSAKEQGIVEMAIEKAKAVIKPKLAAAGILTPVACKAKQKAPPKGGDLKTVGKKSFRKVMFKKSFTKGLAGIATLKVSLKFAGSFGANWAFGIDDKTLIIGMAQAAATATGNFFLNVFGKAGPFAAGCGAKIEVVNLSVPVSGVVLPLKMNFGYDISWKVLLFKATIRAGVRGPGMKCKNKAGRNRPRNYRGILGKGKRKREGKRRAKRRLGATGQPWTANYYPGINGNTNPAPGKALALELGEMLKKEPKKLGEMLKKEKKLGASLNSRDTSQAGYGMPVSMPCLTTPCNLWWEPGCSGKCGISDGCDKLKGTKPTKDLYMWPGITKGGTIFSKEPKCRL